MTAFPSSVRPNFLWISFEDTNPRFGCYGDPIARTPIMDQFAAEGCRFSNAFSTCPACAPSRASIITGLYATSIGAHHMRTVTSDPETHGMPTPYFAVPPHYVKCVTETLRAEGYFCTNNGKTDYNFESPLTAWDQCGERPSSAWENPPAPALWPHWRNREPGQPFFAVFNLNDTHETCMWDPDKWHDQPDDTTETDPASVPMPPYLPDTPKARKALARHYDKIAYNDRLVGKILAQLEEDGLADHTVVFIWSDHGCGLPRSKREVYDSGTHVPLMVRWPGQCQPGTVDERVVSLIDLAPTVLSLASIPLPPFLQGQPFLGPAAQPRQYAFSTRDRMDDAYDMVRGARSARYRYVRNYYPNRNRFPATRFLNRHPVMEEVWRLAAEEKLTPEVATLFAPKSSEELFDLANDPWEMNNLAEDPAHAEILAEHRAAVDRWQRETGDLGSLSEDELVYRMWRGRYQPVTAIPTVTPTGPHYDGRDPVRSDNVLRGPLHLHFDCSTQGASIAWRLDEDPAGQWRLYTRPLLAKAGNRLKLNVKAIRYGYKESKSARVRIQVE